MNPKSYFHYLTTDTLLHDFMDVKTVLNLEAKLDFLSNVRIASLARYLETNSTRLCQDSVTNTQQMEKGEYQKNLDAILLDSGEETACSDRSLDCFNSC